MAILNQGRQSSDVMFATLDQDSDPGVPTYGSRHWIKIAILAFRRTDHDLATQAFRRTDRDPGSTAIRVGLGVGHTISGDL